MIMPPKIKNIISHLTEVYSDNRATSIAPPMIIKGLRGAGKSWVLNEVYEHLEGGDSVVPIKVPFLLSPEDIVSVISRIIQTKKEKFYSKQTISTHKTELKFLLFIEEIDRLYNLPGSQRTYKVPSRARGAGASIMRYVHAASELRKFLIENSAEVSILATAGIDTSFMEDSDQPFFHFFNIIELEPLTKEQSYDYLKNMVLVSNSMEFVEVLEETNPFWVHTITDGKINLLNNFADTLHEAADERDFFKKKIKTSCSLFLNRFFRKSQTEVELDLSDLSPTELKIVDRIVDLPDDFLSKNVKFSGNLSKHLNELESKEILESNKLRGRGHNARYKFKSNHLKAYLRFFRHSPYQDVINPGRGVSNTIW